MGSRAGCGTTWPCPALPALLLPGRGECLAPTAARRSLRWKALIVGRRSPSDKLFELLRLRIDRWRFPVHFLLHLQDAATVCALESSGYMSRRGYLKLTETDIVDTLSSFSHRSRNILYRFLSASGKQDMGCNFPKMTSVTSFDASLIIPSSSRCHLVLRLLEIPSCSPGDAEVSRRSRDRPPLAFL